MSDKNERDLTTLEYIVLGLISMEPQSGYSVVSYFESEFTSWSASPGSIYPMLKRLEKQAIIEGELEMTYETRPRKVYTLTDKGAILLDSWLHDLPKLMPFYEEREIAMWRFIIMEKRMNRDEVLKWLNDYYQLVTQSDEATQFHKSTLEAMQPEETPSLHRQLAVESAIMDINTLRTWLEMAIRRLS